ncbi:hypothetical protein ACIQ6Y_16915 [Streptomyces sp. NPDC096205]|uniref:hypothetical protein n=1 Tax=Streptomyces sp. NPDC096205 TaxID=3366081 RepID=UPI0037FCD163
MRTRTAQLLCLIAVLAAGCGQGRSGGDGGDDGGGSAGKGDAGRRARQVAAAWDGSDAAEAWRRGFYPMADLVQLPDHAFRSAADKEAYQLQNFALRGQLPTTAAQKGTVKWGDGRALTLPVMDAREAFGTLDRYSGEGPELVVTGARLGRTELATSRGPATVPAWLFTIRGYDTPLKRVALAPSEAPKSPIGPAAEVPSDVLWPLEQVKETAQDGRSVTVLAGHGDCDDGPAVDVLETGGSVVLSGSIRNPSEGDCPAVLKITKVTVTLARPLGDRVLLDAFTGRPVPYGTEFGRNPSWD